MFGRNRDQGRSCGPQRSGLLLALVVACLGLLLAACGSSQTDGLILPTVDSADIVDIPGDLTPLPSPTLADGAPTLPPAPTMMVTITGTVPAENGTPVATATWSASPTAPATAGAATATVFVPTATPTIANQEATVTWTPAPTFAPPTAAPPTVPAPTNAPAQPTATAVVREGDYQVAFVRSGTGLNLRSEPGYDAPVVATLWAGAGGIQVTFDGAVESGGTTWLRAVTPDGEGWANARYLTQSVSHEAFCPDPAVAAVIQKLQAAIANDDAQLLASIVHPQHGLRLRLNAQGEEVIIEPQDIVAAITGDSAAAMGNGTSVGNAQGTDDGDDDGDNSGSNNNGQGNNGNGQGNNGNNGNGQGNGNGNGQANGNGNGNGQGNGNGNGNGHGNGNGQGNGNGNGNGNGHDKGNKGKQGPNQTYYWGQLSKDDKQLRGTFKQVMKPVLAKDLLGATQWGCDELLSGKSNETVVLPDGYEQVHFYTGYRPAPNEHSAAWGSWAIGIERWRDAYYLSYLVHYGRGD